jgi:hypothetical protein
MYLFDQDGQPIRLHAKRCHDGSHESSSGQDNGFDAYPLPNVVNDPQAGRCVTVPGVPSTALVPRATAPPTVAGTSSSAPNPSSGVGPAPSTAPAPSVDPRSPRSWRVHGVARTADDHGVGLAVAPSLVHTERG